MVKLIKTQCKSYLCAPYFLLCAICAGCACLFDVALYEDAGSALTVLECIISKFTQGTDLTADLSAIELWLQAGGNSFSMLVPIIASLPFAVPACIQRKSGNLRFILPRTNIWGYCLSGLLSAMVVGGLVLALGILLYGLLLLIFFPILYGISSSFALAAFQKLLGLFLLGCGNTLLTYLLCFFSSNLYLVVCIPFLVRYVMTYTVEWINLLLFSSPNSLLSFLIPGTIQTAPYGEYKGILSLVFMCVCMVVCFILAIRQQSRRTDCGE